MIATYKLNADKLDNQMIESTKSAFYGKEINIIITESVKNQITSNELSNRINDLVKDNNKVEFTQHEFNEFVNKLVGSN